MNTPQQIFAVDQVIPHRGDISLLHSVLECSADTCTAVVQITHNSPFAHTQGVPNYVGLEYMAQTIAAWSGHQLLSDGKAIRFGFFLGSRKYQCRQSHFMAGQTLHITMVKVMEDSNGIGVFDCEILVDKCAIATARLKAFQPENIDDHLNGTTL